MNQKQSDVGQSNPSPNRKKEGADNTPSDKGGFEEDRVEQKPSSFDREKTDLVTILGIVSIVFGGLKLLCGGGVLFGFQYFYDELVQFLASGDYPSPEQLSSTIQFVLVVFVLLFVVIPGILQVVGGTGVLKRKNWGRILTIILGGLDAVLALPNLLSGNVVGFALAGGWGVFALYVLLSDPYQTEFYDRSPTAQPR